MRASRVGIGRCVSNQDQLDTRKNPRSEAVCDGGASHAFGSIRCIVRRILVHPRNLSSLAKHLENLSRNGDSLEVSADRIEFERSRLLLTRGFGYSDVANGGRPPFDPLAMFKVLGGSGTA